MNILRVALDLPLPRVFDYLCDEATPADIGMRVLVPFGNKHAVGVIVGLADKSEIESGKLKAALRILRDTPALARDWLELAQFCSGYYHRPLGEVIFNGLPRQLRQAGATPALKQAIAYRISASGREALTQLPARARVKRALLQTLLQSECAEELLLAQSPSAKKALAELASAAWIERYQVSAAPRGGRFVEKFPLNAEQQQVLQQIEGAGPGYGVFLLHGITGSGKTEIYLRLIAGALAAGKQALVLVPEINLTPRLMQEFGERFPDAPLVSSAQRPRRRRAHAALAAGAKRRRGIVLGTRLAVFVPMPKLALIVVDEEQDASFKQQDGLRYSARDVAIFRARQAGIPIVLGSATPALETYAHALSGRYRLLQLCAARRAAGATAAGANRWTLRRHKLEDGLAPPVMQALADMPRARRAKPGVSEPPRLCAGADVPGLRLGERLQALLRPHGAASGRQATALPPLRRERARPAPLPELRQRRISTPSAAARSGWKRRWPRASRRRASLRVDRDSTRNKGSFARMLGDIHGGRADILVGTQILAKGHDFPQSDPGRRAQRRQRAVFAPTTARRNACSRNWCRSPDAPGAPACRAKF